MEWNLVSEYDQSMAWGIGMETEDARLNACELRWKHHEDGLGSLQLQDNFSRREKDSIIKIVIFYK